jgi:hypothetical protein
MSTPRKKLEESVEAYRKILEVQKQVSKTRR